MLLYSKCALNQESFYALVDATCNGHNYFVLYTLLHCICISSKSLCNKQGKGRYLVISSTRWLVLLRAMLLFAHTMSILLDQHPIGEKLKYNR